MTGPPPPVAAVRVAVRRVLAELPTGAHVLVACSGGADSLALAAATAFVTRERARAGAALTAGAAVVDHGWHPASASVATTAADTCRGLGLTPVQVLDVSRQAAAGAGGPEAVARKARYAALDRAADEQGAAAVLLGHTLDDQAETVLLGLARGSGARLRSAMSLLDQALGPGLPAALARTAAQLAQDADALDGYAEDLLRRARVPGGYDVTVLAAAPDAVRRRALLAIARAAGALAGALSSRHALALDGLVVQGGRRRGARHGPVHLPGGVVAVCVCGTLSLAAPGGPLRAG